MTLMPVSKISVFGSRSANFGASRWIGHRWTSSPPSSGPASSTGSPSTFRIRPSAGAPTGTEMAAPVSTTSIPRMMPSVEDIATARTCPRPMCCCTSAVILKASPAASVPSSTSAL